MPTPTIERAALAGRARFDGRVLINGVKYDDGLAACGGAFALCPQEDVMYRNLTVGENVWLSATLRLGRPRAGRDFKTCVVGRY